MEDIGAGRIAVVERDHRLVHEIVARRHAGEGGTERLFRPPAELLRPLRFRLHAENLCRDHADDARSFGGGQIALVLGRPEGDQQTIVEEIVDRHVEATISHFDRPVRGERFGEALAKLPPGDRLEARFEPHIRDHIQFEFEDNAEQAVAAHGVAEHIAILSPGAAADDAVRKHHLQRAHRGAATGIGDRPAMSVDE